MNCGNHTILIGDVRERLRDVRAGSVQTCVTSPPYFGLRSYDTGDAKHLEIGSEKTPEEFIATMVDVFRLVRDCLRDDGTIWVNLGDSYNQYNHNRGESAGSLEGRRNVAQASADRGLPANCPPGSQLLMPHRVAMALAADGWILRSTVVWHKRSPMPESISGWRWRRCGKQSLPDADTDTNPELRRDRQQRRDFGSPVFVPCPGCPKCSANGGYVLRRGKWRPTTGHEYVFLFSKSERYYGDGDAVAEMASDSTAARLGMGRRQLGELKHGDAGTVRMNGSFARGTAAITETRNPRSVWTLSSEAYRDAHFATFPSELVRRCILATSPAECCSACGAGYAPVVVTERVPTRPGVETKCYENQGAYNPESPYLDHAAIGNRDPQRHIQRTRIEGYRPTCACQAAPGRSLVLDPFLGSGTTAQVATHYGRDAVGCELSEKYAALAEARITQPPRCLLKAEKRKAPKPTPAVPMLFDLDGLTGATA